MLSFTGFKECLSSKKAQANYFFKNLLMLLTCNINSYCKGAVIPTNIAMKQEDPLGTILLSCDYIFSTIKYRVKIQQKEGSKELTTTDYDVKTDVTTHTDNNRQTIRIKVKTGYTYNIQMASVVNDITVSDFSAIKTVMIGKKNYSFNIFQSTFFMMEVLII